METTDEELKEKKEKEEEEEEKRKNRWRRGGRRIPTLARWEGSSFDDKASTRESRDERWGSDERGCVCVCV